MRILLSGGTGLIGRALCRRWLQEGHELLVWSRSPEQVPQLCGAAVRGVASLEELGDIELDAVINLAGAPIAERHWTRRRKALLWDSRIHLTERLVEWLAGLSRRPPVLISGSAVGWYGDGGERLLHETDTPQSSDFASQLCIAWEESAQRAQELGMRVVLVRTGLVLASNGGFLARLLPPFRLGLGGRIGSGRQWMPWIHLHDQVALVDFLLRHPSASGAYNACAPQPVRNAEFTRCLAQALHRPALLPLPAPVLRVGFGELSGLLLGGQHVLPERLQAEGFEFRFTELSAALADLLEGKNAES